MMLPVLTDTVIKVKSQQAEKTMTVLKPLFPADAAGLRIHMTVFPSDWIAAFAAGAVMWRAD
jgi:hypothetical protein